MKKISAILLLVGCGQLFGDIPGSTPVPPDSLREARQAWAVTGLPGPGECPMRQLVVGDDGIRGWCRAEPPGQCSSAPYCAAGCTFFRTGNWYLVIHEHYPDVWAHEVGHAFSACAMGDTDSGHSDPRVWDDWLGSFPH